MMINNKLVIKIGLITVFVCGLLIVIYIRKHPTKVQERKGMDCTSVTVEYLLKFGSNNKFLNGIPRIVHYNYNSESVPLRFNALVKQCQSLNRNVVFVFWRDFTALKFIRLYFPNYLDLYLSYLKENVEPLKSSDIIRYFILYKLGGVYMDLDTMCQKSLNEVMSPHSCILSQEASAASKILWHMEYVVMNSFMSCHPKHSFFKFVIDNLTRENGTSVMHATGPIFLTKIYHWYTLALTHDKNKEFHDTVFLESSDQFSPYIEPYIDNHCSSPATEWMIMACEELRVYRKTESIKIRNAVLVHLFFHSGYEWGRKRIGATKSICSENIIFVPNFL